MRTCEEVVLGGLCGNKATHKGMTTGAALCMEHAIKRSINDSEVTRFLTAEQTEKTTSDKEIESALSLCHRLQSGAAKMSREQFRASLRLSIGASKEYADGVYITFKDSPSSYLASRNPQSQSLDLIRIILDLTK